MGIVVTALSGLAVISCLLSPVWGACAYVIVNVVRPNEHFEGVMFPVIPLMIVVMGISYFIHNGRKLPSLGAEQPRTVLLFTLMACLLLLHLLIWRRDIMVQWILSEFSPLIFLLLFSARHMSTPPRLKSYFTALMAGASATAGQAVFVHFLRKGAQRTVLNEFGDQVISHGMLWDSFHLRGGRLQGKAGGTFGNSNDLGMVINWAIPGAIYYLRQRGSKVVRILAGALLAMLFTALFLTGSRGGQLQLGVTMWMLFVGGKRKALGIVILVVALVGVMVVLPRFRPERGDAAASSSERLELAKDGVKLFAWKPVIGVGFYRFPDFAHTSLFPHNVYIQALAETGLIGSLIFFPLIFLLRRDTSRAVKYFESGGDYNLGLLARSIGGLQFSYLIFLLFSNQFMRFTFALVMTPCIALYTAMIRERRAVAEGAGEGGEGEGSGETKTRALAPLVYPRRSAASEDPDAAVPEEERSSQRYIYDPLTPATGVQALIADDDDDDDVR